MADLDPYRAAITEARTALKEANNAAADALAQLKSAVVAGYHAGLPQDELKRLSQFTSVVVMLADAKRSRSKVHDLRSGFAPTPKPVSEPEPPKVRLDQFGEPEELPEREPRQRRRGQNAKVPPVYHTQ
jgi:hypothetical protein